MAFELVQSNDAAPYLTEAQTLAQDAQLDFLEIVGPDGNIVSSAQWPARFGYPEPAAAKPTQTPFLKREELPDGSSALGLFAVRAIHGAEPAVKLVGGKRLDQSFLADLPVAPGMQVGLYSDAGAANARRVRMRAAPGRHGFRSEAAGECERRSAGRSALCIVDRPGTQQRPADERHPLSDATTRRQRECDGDSAEERSRERAGGADSGDFAQRTGGGAAADSRHRVRRRERRHPAGDHLQPVDCGARLAADRGIGARGRGSGERELGYARAGARARRGEQCWRAASIT